MSSSKFQNLFKPFQVNKVTYKNRIVSAPMTFSLSALDPQVKAFALMAPIARFPDWYLYGSASGVPQGEQKEQFIKSFLPINPETMIRKSNAQFFLQFALNDHYISKEQADQLIKAAPPKAETHFYPTDHAMKIPAVTEDRLSWLQKVLELN